LDTDGGSGAIDWGKVRERLPGTAHDLLDQIHQACKTHPNEAPRAIERELRTQIASLRARFKEASGGNPS